MLTAFEDLPGTEIVAELGNDMERNAIAGIAADRNEARITLTRILDRPGMVSAVIGPLAAAGVQVDMIVHSATEGVGESDLTFTVAARKRGAGGGGDRAAARMRSPITTC